MTDWENAESINFSYQELAQGRCVCGVLLYIFGSNILRSKSFFFRATTATPTKLEFQIDEFIKTLNRAKNARTVRLENNQIESLNTVMGKINSR